MMNSKDVEVDGPRGSTVIELEELEPVPPARGKKSPRRSNLVSYLLSQPFPPYVLCLISYLLSPISYLLFIYIIPLVSNLLTFIMYLHTRRKVISQTHTH